MKTNIMKTKIIRWCLKLSLIIACLQLFSCTVAYKSIKYQKSEGNIMAKTQISHENEKLKNNKTFIHFGDTIFQLNKLNINRSINGQKKGVSGEIVPVNSHYAEVYEVMREEPKGRPIHLRKIAGPSASYIKQTHIFADSIVLSEANIEVLEEDVLEVTSYYPSFTLLYILVLLGLLMAVLIALFAVALSKFSIGNVP